MNLEAALSLIGRHYEHAKQQHPEPKTLDTWHDHIVARLADVSNALAETETPDHKLIAGKRALQVATMALRLIEELDLGLVGPEYDACNLPHSNP